ncbi:MAG: M23 family metallopeptidase [Cellulomonas sp.]|jgi:murein DD-endopeptidase MepM/ murein hydrolase activator NlpD|nr:M23 family metallopeptidase [Cellulomonas sp.]
MRIALAAVTVVMPVVLSTGRGPAEPPDPTGWVAPVAQVSVVQPFDPPEQVWSAGHRGVDLVAEPGTATLAPCAGTVTFVGTVVDRPVLTVGCQDGLRSSVEPVLGTVTVGQRVVPGDPVGTVVASAATHCAPATCLHWGVRRGTQYVDPMSLLRGAGPIVLLPDP